METLFVFKNPSLVSYKELKNVLLKSKTISAKSNVFLDIEHNKIVATNDVALVAYPMSVISKSELISDGFVVNPLLFDTNKWTVVEELKESVKDGFYDFEVRDDGFVYVVCEGEELYRAQYYTDFDYPQWYSVVPNGGEYVIDLILNASVLGDVCKAIPKCLNGNMKLIFNGSSKAVKFTVDVDENAEILGVIMPVGYATN